MKTKNKIWPSTEPCRFPDVTDTWEDFSFSKTTVCGLQYRNTLIQWRMVSSDLLFSLHLSV